MSSAAAFLDARRTLFAAVTDQHVARSGAATGNPQRVGLLETADLLALASLVEAYAGAYASFAAAALGGERGELAEPAPVLAALATLDTVELRWRGPVGVPNRALILSPTHPLRVLWHLRHAAATNRIVSDWHGGKAVPSWPRFLDRLLGLRPVNLPQVLFDERGRGYVECGLLAGGWSLYAPEAPAGSPGPDPSEYRSTVCQFLELKPHDAADLSPDAIAQPIQEYLQLHPYVGQLRINVFGSGDGRVVAEALRELEKWRVGQDRWNPPPLRYCVQLFSHPQSIASTGEALEDLLDPDRQVGQDDEFTLASSNHLFPKLVFSRNPLAAFADHPDSFPAHVAIVADQFALQCRLGNVAALARGLYLNGLVSEPDVTPSGDGSGVTWVKGVNPGAASPDALEGRVLAAVQSAQAAVATGRPQPTHVAPVVALRVAAESQALMRAVHSACDWVLTVDRNLGIEFYDRRDSDDTGYLLDFTPEYLQADRRKVFLTTRRPAELEAFVRPAMEQFGLPAADPVPRAVVETLRSLSGRLALRLIASPSQTAEVVGLLLARWLLGEVGALADHVVIPLDAHRRWFATDKSGTLPDPSGKRADLLLAGFSPNERRIRLHVVEVKLREDVTAVGRHELYRYMAEQTARTCDRLRQLFDPNLYPEPRPDSALLAKEFGTLLRFYIDRGARYGLINPAAAEEAKAFVTGLDAGYHLDLKATGVFFHRRSAGAHTDEEEPGFPVHRFGADVACRLVARAAALPEASDPSRQSSTAAGSATPAQPPPLDPSVLDPFASSIGLPPATTRRPPAPVPTLVPAAEAQAEMGNTTGPTRPVEGLAPTKPAPRPSEEQQEGATPEQTPPITAAEVAPLAPGPTAPTVEADVVLGATQRTTQFGIIGKAGSTKVAIDLTGCNTISLFGVQGFGKSYTLGVVAEMAVRAVAGINRLPAPLATVIFHYHKSDAYAPEFLSAVAPNARRSEVDRLRDEYGASPAGLTDVVLLTPAARVEDRRREYPSVEVRPILFRSAELDVEAWKFLLGAYGNDSLYVRQMVAIMRRHRAGLTLARLEEELRDADLAPGTRRLADDRLNLARPYVDDGASLADLLRPGRTVIVDLRDQWVEKDEALGLFVVMLRIFAAARHGGKSFNKMVIFDEAHKYISDSDLVGQVVETIREMRHQATSVIIASQDPLSVPRSVVELTSVLLLHRMTSPQWLKHLKGAISALEPLTDAQVAGLAPGEALVWSQRATELRFTQRPVKLTVRPRFSQHGGATKTAVEGESIR
jgi:hypothetical protein